MEEEIFEEINEEIVLAPDRDIRINKAVMHILDTNAGIPVLSEMFLNIGEGVGDYLLKHLEKSLKDSEIKHTLFLEGSGFQKTVEEYKKSEALIRISSEIAQSVFDVMVEHVDIPSADLIFIDFERGFEKFLAILKFNYKQGYIHYVDTEKGFYNDILVQPCVLPTERQRLDEFVIINLSTGHLLLKEKKYLINNQKEFYWSKQILFCEEGISEKSAYEIVEKTAKKVIESEYSGSYEKMNQMKEALVENYESSSELDVEQIADSVFMQDELVKEKFRQGVLQNGLYEDKVKVSANLEKKLYKKQKFITDTGIEISIPLEQLKRDEVIEFKNNPDGTISVMIKNIALLNMK
ncbi:nucleoid-associated protein [Eubacteriaceae bacterium ES3]|nr:nucleoid-associated protein [Eubacteriaceae bacterium ES3]